MTSTRSTSAADTLKHVLDDILEVQPGSPLELFIQQEGIRTMNDLTTTITYEWDKLSEIRVVDTVPADKPREKPIQVQRKLPSFVCGLLKQLVVYSRHHRDDIHNRNVD